MDLRSDPRLNPKVLKALETLGLDRNNPQSDLTSKSSIEDLTPLMEQLDVAFCTLYDTIQIDLPGDESEPQVERTTKIIKGPDNNDIMLYVHRRADASDEALPCVIYTHGGGMTFLSTANKVHFRWCTSLAIAGVVSIAVDFRNAYTKEGRNPFSTGLNDCAAAVRYIASHKSEFRIGKVITQGESGGANLALAIALKAKQENWINEIAGVYACAPFISNLWNMTREQALKELPSILENDQYLLGVRSMDAHAAYYTHTENTADPLAWPYHATVEDLKGLPPHHLLMDELDPLRDEGIAYYRKLLAAGVSVVGNINLGVVHATSLIFRQAVPEVHNSVVQSIAAFARGL